jgi:hypothetical protein
MAEPMEGIFEYLEQIAKPTRDREFYIKNKFYFDTENDSYDGYNYGITAVHEVGSKKVKYPILICYTDCYDIDDKFEIYQYEYIEDLNVFVTKQTLEFENGIGEPDLTFEKAKALIAPQIEEFYKLIKYRKINDELNQIKRDF